MKSVLKFGIALILLALPSIAFAESIIWRVSGEQGTLYLAGSIHVLRHDDYPLPDEFEAAWNDTATLYLEISPRELTDPTAALPYVNLFIDPDRRTLDQMLAEDADSAARREIRSLVAAMELDLSGYQMFRPWYVALGLMQTELMNHGYDPAWGVDRHFSNRAAADQRPSFGLETLGDQLSILGNMEPDEEIAFLISVLRDLSELEVMIEPMLSAWADGDEDALADLLNSGFDEFPELGQRLLQDRNQNWFEILRPMADQPGRHMVVVGALHLVGDDGLVRMFEDAGYRVEQL